MDKSGLTLLSWKLSESIPLWANRMFDSATPMFDFYFKSSCYLEILASVPKKLESPFNASFVLSMPVNSYTFIGDCKYVTVAVGWERKSDSSNPPRPAFLICPV